MKYLVTTKDWERVYDENDTLDLIGNRGHACAGIRDYKYNGVHIGHSVTYFCLRTHLRRSKSFTFKEFDKNALDQAKEFKKIIDEKNDVYKNKLELSVKNICEKLNIYTRYYKIYLKEKEYDEQDLPIPPYILGLWLGDGTALYPEITNIDKEVIDEIYNYADNNRMKVRKKGNYSYALSSLRGTRFTYEPSIIIKAAKELANGSTRKNIKEKYDICEESCTKYKKIYQEGGTKAVKKYIRDRTNIFGQSLNKLNLIENKHIPDIYKYNTIENRLELLAGLIDSDGSLSCSKTYYEISQCVKHERLLDNIIEVCTSLGFKTCKRARKTHYYKDNIKKTFDSHRLFITGDVTQVPVRIPRKKALKKTQRYDYLWFKIKEHNE